MARWFAGLCVLTVSLGVPATLTADDAAAIIVIGTVEKRSEGANRYTALEKGTVLSAGDVIRTGVNSYAEIALQYEVYVRIYPRSTLLIEETSRRNMSTKVLTGETWHRADISVGRSNYQVRTDEFFAEARGAAVIGTTYRVNYNPSDQSTTVMVMEGQVLVDSIDNPFLDPLQLFTIPGNESVASQISMRPGDEPDAGDADPLDWRTAFKDDDSRFMRYFDRHTNPQGSVEFAEGYTFDDRAELQLTGTLPASQIRQGRRFVARYLDRRGTEIMLVEYDTQGSAERILRRVYDGSDLERIAVYDRAMRFKFDLDYNFGVLSTIRYYDDDSQQSAEKTESGGQIRHPYLRNGRLVAP